MHVNHDLDLPFINNVQLENLKVFDRFIDVFHHLNRILRLSKNESNGI